MNLYLLRDFAEAYADYRFQVSSASDEEMSVLIAETAVALGVMCTELQAFNRAAAILKASGAVELAVEDRPMVERLRLNAAVRFARKLALLPPTEKT